MRHFFYSLISFIVALFFILLGIVGILLPWAPGVKSSIVNFIQEDGLFIFLFGLGLTIIGAAIATYIILSTRKRYYEIRSGDNLTTIDESLFQDYLNTYWKQLFPKFEIPNRVILKKNLIHVSADLPYIPDSQQKVLIERIEKDLNDIFNRILGRRHEYVISISFQPETDTNVPSTKT
jgi:hypothetical protein